MSFGFATPKNAKMLKRIESQQQIYNSPYNKSTRNEKWKRTTTTQHFDLSNKFATAETTKITAAAAVVFCPTGRFSFSIDTILLASVLFPWVVNNPCFCHLSPAANSVAFLLVFLFPSFLAVDLPTLFSPKNHDATHVVTLFSIFLIVTMSSFLVSTVFNSSLFFGVLSKISSTCDAKSPFQLFQSKITNYRKNLPKSPNQNHKRCVTKSRNKKQ